MTKEEKYILLVKQVRAVLEGEADEIARMANVAALVHETMGFWWTGFYRVCGEELVLGPFQGPVACSRIAFGRGVCGTAWKERRTVIVPDVDQFPGHIACSSASRSEIVVPVFRPSSPSAPSTSSAPSSQPGCPSVSSDSRSSQPGSPSVSPESRSSQPGSPSVSPDSLPGPVVAVLDIDSRELAAFDDTDRVYLEQIAALIP